MLPTLIPMLPPALLAFVQDTPAGTPTGAQTGAPGGAPAQPVGGLDGFLRGPFPMLILIVAVFYFLMIRPEKKQRKKREEMLGKLQKGDKVMTTGGLYAVVAQVQDQIVTLQISEGVRARFAVSAVQSVLQDDAVEGLKEKT